MAESIGSLHWSITVGDEEARAQLNSFYEYAKEMSAKIAALKPQLSAGVGGATQYGGTTGTTDRPVGPAPVVQPQESAERFNGTPVSIRETIDRSIGDAVTKAIPAEPRDRGPLSTEDLSRHPQMRAFVEQAYSRNKFGGVSLSATGVNPEAEMFIAANADPRGYARAEKAIETSRRPQITKQTQIDAQLIAATEAEANASRQTTNARGNELAVRGRLLGSMRDEADAHEEAASAGRKYVQSVVIPGGEPEEPTEPPVGGKGGGRGRPPRPKRPSGDEDDFRRADQLFSRYSLRAVARVLTYAAIHEASQIPLKLSEYAGERLAAGNDPLAQTQAEFHLQDRLKSGLFGSVASALADPGDYKRIGAELELASAKIVDARTDFSIASKRNLQELERGVQFTSTADPFQRRADTINANAESRRNAIQDEDKLRAKLDKEDLTNLKARNNVRKAQSGIANTLIGIASGNPSIGIGPSTFPSLDKSENDLSKQLADIRDKRLQAQNKASDEILKNEEKQLGFDIQGFKEDQRIRKEYFEDLSAGTNKARAAFTALVKQHGQEEFRALQAGQAPAEQQAKTAADVAEERAASDEIKRQGRIAFLGASNRGFEAEVLAAGTDSSLRESLSAKYGRAFALREIADTGQSEATQSLIEHRPLEARLRQIETQKELDIQNVPIIPSPTPFGIGASPTRQAIARIQKQAELDSEFAIEEKGFETSQIFRQQDARRDELNDLFNFNPIGAQARDIRKGAENRAAQLKHDFQDSAIPGLPPLIGQFLPPIVANVGKALGENEIRNAILEEQTLKRSYLFGIASREQFGADPNLFAFTNTKDFGEGDKGDSALTTINDNLEKLRTDLQSYLGADGN